MSWGRYSLSKFKRNLRIGEQRQWRRCCQWPQSFDIAVRQQHLLNCGGRLGQLATTNHRRRLRFRQRTQIRVMIRFQKLRWAAQRPQLYWPLRLGDVRLCAGRHEADSSRLKWPRRQQQTSLQVHKTSKEFAAFVLHLHALNRQLMVLLPIINLACWYEFFVQKQM